MTVISVIKVIRVEMFEFMYVKLFFFSPSLFTICKSQVDSSVSTTWPQGECGSFKSIFKCLTECQFLHLLFFHSQCGRIRSAVLQSQRKPSNWITWQSVEQNRKDLIHASKRHQSCTMRNLLYNNMEIRTVQLLLQRNVGHLGRFVCLFLEF